MWEIPDPNANSSHIALHKMSVFKFQFDSSYGNGVVVLKVIFYLFTLSDPKILRWPPQNQKVSGLTLDKCLPTFTLIALKYFELPVCPGNQIWPLLPW